ncbi:hypothetical protein EVA_02008 [gut metagenome]|uniref:Uncharacterized protein n=1 Tax=gut metagenome TaxID=749906 RepID=J9DAI6_9ZZZZ
MAAAFPRRQFVFSEEPRLREQEWGYLRTYAELVRLKEERRAYGTFYSLVVRLFIMRQLHLMVETFGQMQSP